MADPIFDWPGPHAERPFLWTETVRWTHGAVAAQAEALLAAVPKGDRILVRANAGVHAVAPLVACWMRGAIAILVDPRESEESAERIAAATHSTIWHPGPALRLTGQEATGASRIRTDRRAVGLRTSGSTGEPKIAVHRLASLLANAAASNRRVPFGHDDCWLLSLSPHHVGGLSILLRAMLAGGCVHVGGGPGALNRDLLEHRWITHVSVVATQLRRMLDDPALDRRSRSLRAILLGGGATPVAWRDEAIARQWPLHVTYGLTECASQVSTARAVAGAEPSDAGEALDGVSVRCAADGEIVVTGPTVFDGYLDHAPVHGAFATGDLGRIDERGRLHVTGRRDAMFVSGGENIQPEEIEIALCSVPGITGACVVAVDDPIWQRRPVAFVAGTFDVAALELALGRLPRFKWPDRILAMPPDEAERAKPRRGVLATRLDGPVLWRRPAGPRDA